MINYTWKILELFANNQLLTSVKYSLTGIEGEFTVTSEGNHCFSEGIVTKPLDQLVETDLIQWIEKDITQNDVNPIKLAIEGQLINLKQNQKVDFPWLAGTFTI